MKRIDELGLASGETVFVDSIEEGVARLSIGEAGERIETVPLESLPAEAQHEGAHLRVGEDGAWSHDSVTEEETKTEVASLMEDVFGSSDELDGELA
jgi:hypothetical protein